MKLALSSLQLSEPDPLITKNGNDNLQTFLYLYLKETIFIVQVNYELGKIIFKLSFILFQHCAYIITAVHVRRKSIKYI